MLKKVFSRPYIVGAALVLQILWLFISVEYLSGVFMPVSFFVQVISVIAILIILNKSGNAAFKLPWVLLILTTPIFGGILYFLTASESTEKKQKKAYEQAEEQAKPHCAVWLGQALPALYEKEPVLAGQFTYLERCGFPVYQNTACQYFPMGDNAFPALLADLEAAEHYIFLEYFIVHQNSMWLEMLEILERKAAQGVEVRLLYDDVATMSTLPKKYPQELAAKGIRCMAFNPFIPVCTISQNHRDHRKIAVVDGRVAYTGGFNLSDEYINREHPHGDSWKDTGVRLEGDAAYQMALFFLTMWSANTGLKEPFESYRPTCLPVTESDGYVQPYTHTPLPGGQIVGDVYRNIINQSSRYLYIYTPYLIPDPETISALCLAAQRGVDVRLILPGVPDRLMIGQMTRAHYEQFLSSGVKLYEYDPGFVHAKCLVSDDKMASVGSANLDYRSLYHSYEDGCLFYGSSVVNDLRNDFIKTLEVCHEVQPRRTRLHIFSGVYYAILRVFSPLL